MRRIRNALSAAGVTAAVALTAAAPAVADSRLGPLRTIFPIRAENPPDILVVPALGSDVLAFRRSRDDDRFHSTESHGGAPFGERRSFRSRLAFVDAVADDSGRVVGLFPGTDGMWARVRPPGGSFGPPQPLPAKRRAVDRHVDGFGLVKTPSGDVIALWTAFGRFRRIPFCDYCDGYLFASVLRRGAKRFGPTQTLEPGNRAVWEVQIVFDGAGNGLLVWNEEYDYERGTLTWAVLPPGGTAFGPKHQLPAEPDETVARLDVAANDAGRTVAIWEAVNEHERNRLKAAFGTVTGGFDSLQPLAERPGSTPDVAVGPSGAARAGWADPRPRLAAALPHGQFGPSQLLDDAPSKSPTIVHDGAGTFTLAWRTAKVRALHVVRQAAGSSVARVVELAPDHVWRITLRTMATHETLLAWSVRAHGLYSRLVGVRVGLAPPHRPFAPPLDLETGPLGNASKDDFVGVERDPAGGAFLWWRKVEDRHSGFFGRFLLPPAGGDGAG